MAIIHITDSVNLKAGDKASFAPFGVPYLFANDPSELEEKDGLVGFRYDEDEFFPVVNPDGSLIDNLTLVDATRDVFNTEAPENVGKEVFSSADLPAEYGVRVIIRHTKHGDYRGFASNDAIDGWETIRLIDNMGHGSFQFWKSDGFRIYLAVELDYPYNF
jgi:hypothetical protein